MAIRLVAIDLDGTLLTSDKQITPRTVDAIAECTSRGIRVVLASARPPRSVVGFYRQLRLNTSVINYNGALVYDPPAKEVVHHQPLSPDVAGQVIEFARRRHNGVLVSVEALDKWFTDRYDQRYQTETAKHYVPDTVGPVESWLTCAVTKLMFLGPRDVMDDLEQVTVPQFAGKIAMVRTDDDLLQIMHPQVSKRTALDKVCRQYDISPAEVLAVGDAPNDVAMLAWAGIGVAMSNAPESVRQVADYITVDNDHDGAAQAIEWFALEQRDRPHSAIDSGEESGV